MTARPRPALWRWALRSLGPIALIWIVARLPDPARLWDLLRGASPPLLALAFALNLVNIELKVERWRRLLAERGIEYDRRRARVAFLSSSYAGFFTPGRVGDVLRAEYLRRDRGTPFSEGVLSVVVDRVCDVAALGVAVALSLFHLRDALTPQIARIGWGLVAAAGVGSALFVAMSIRRVRAPEPSAGGKVSLGGLLSRLTSFSPRALAAPMALTAVTFGITFLQGYLLARAIGVSLSFADVSALLSAATFLGLLPITVSGVGVREALFAAVLPARGFSADSGVALGLLVFAVIYVGIALIGLVAWIARPPAAASGQSADAAREGSAPTGTSPASGASRPLA